MMKVSMNIGFVTNSSSCIHHFPSEVLRHPKIQAFLKIFAIEDGFVSEELFDRSLCTTVAVSRDQKAAVQTALNSEDPEDLEDGPFIDVESDEVVVIFGDEYDSIAKTLSWMMAEVLTEVYGGDTWDHQHRKSREFN